MKSIEEFDGLMDNVRRRFAHVDTCPFTGPRVFFENAGGALTLKSVVETTVTYAAIPDNQGRANAASAALNAVIDKSKSDMACFFNAKSGAFFVGESGTEVLFRLIRAAILGSDDCGIVLGSTLEHPASASACRRWAAIAGKPYVAVDHDPVTGSVSAEAYGAKVTADTRVATIIHTSPVSGMGVDVGAIVKTIRATAPDCVIIIDGIQHAAHGGIDIEALDVDGYAVSPYKVFSRHGYGLGWTSDRLRGFAHDALDGGPPENWELGTRDTGAYATFSDVVEYFQWLGSQVSDATDPRAQIEAAARAIHSQESALADAAVNGIGNLKGLADMNKVTIIGGARNPQREGLLAITVDGVASVDVVEKLNGQGIRTHLRKADHYSGNVLDPLGLDSCIRVSFCHYNSMDEIRQLLTVMHAIAE
jgi:cysteine desulfurase/selenocysteine lyase